jgi:Domain of unknown function (DUF4286)
MITYQVTATVEPELTASYEAFMRHHIPALLATGCFTAARLSRGEAGRYQAEYYAPDRAALERYLSEHAPRLRSEFAAAFPTGITVTRAVWDAVRDWP